MPPTSNRNPKRRLVISLLLGLALSAGALYLALRNVPLHDLAEYLAQVDYRWVAPTVILIVASFMVRAWRWQIILGSTRAVSFSQAFHPLMIGFMLNCTLPGRVGEVARPAILNVKDRYPFASALATVAAERVLDAATLMLLFAAVSTAVTIDPSLSIPVGGGLVLNRETLLMAATGLMRLAALVFLGILALAIDPSRHLIQKMIMGLPALVPALGAATRDKLRQRICAPLVRFSDTFADGLRLVRQPARLGACLALSLLIWALTTLGYYAMALGCPGIDLSLAEIAAVMVIICLFIALPSVPGFWGLWEAGGMFALAIFGISGRQAAGYTLVNHAVQLLPVVFVGLLSAARTGLNIMRIVQQRGQEAPDHPATD